MSFEAIDSYEIISSLFFKNFDFRHRGSHALSFFYFGLIGQKFHLQGGKMSTSKIDIENLCGAEMIHASGEKNASKINIPALCIKCKYCKDIGHNGVCYCCAAYSQVWCYDTQVSCIDNCQAPPPPNMEHWFLILNFMYVVLFIINSLLSRNYINKSEMYSKSRVMYTSLIILINRSYYIGSSLMK